MCVQLSFLMTHADLGKWSKTPEFTAFRNGLAKDIRTNNAK